MKKQIFTALVFSANVSAAVMGDPCINMAKYGAIRAYMSETGTVQGSEGIQYSARLVQQQGNVFDYQVTISDNNEDGETWDVEYEVKVQQRGNTCKVITVSGLGL